MEGGIIDTQGGNARKRLKISRKVARASLPLTDKAAMPLTSTTNGGSSKSAQMHIHDGNCHHETALKSLHTDIDAMRHLVTCQICHRFMYEPYALSCGHTYCYSCLTQWLGGNAKKTCPDCRAVISQQPTPSYVIRELVLIFVSRNQLLPDGETAEENNGMARDEAELVAKDKANTDPRTGGLFKGCFKPGGRFRLLPIHDPGDGVDRCPRCHWEVEDGYCNHCGEPVGDAFSDFSGESVDTEDEVDHDFGDFDGDADLGLDSFVGGPIHVDMPDTDGEDLPWGEDGHMADVDPAVFEATFGGAPHGLPRRTADHNGRHTHAPFVTISSDRSDDGSGSESDEHDSDMDGFIDDDEGHHHAAHESDVDDSDDTEVQELPHQPRRRAHAHVVISDDEDEDAGATQAGAISLDDSDDEVPVLGTVGRIKRNRAVPRSRPVAISSDEESSDEESTAQQLPESIAEGFSSLEEGSEDEDAAPSVHFDQSDAASEAGSMQPHYYHDEVADKSGSDDDDDSENGYESATTAEPPPSTRDAHNRLQTNVQRRSRYSNEPLGPVFRQSPTMSANNRSQAASRNNNNFSYHTRAHQQSPDDARYRHLASADRLNALHHARRNHPFQLSNTLAGINNRSRLQQNSSAEPSRSVSAASSRSQSSTNGGVDVNSQSSAPGSGSSSGSSRTIGRGDAREALMCKRPASGTVQVIGYDRLQRVYGTRH